MARSHLRFTLKDKEGNAIQNALIQLLQHGSTAAASDAWTAESGGTPVTELVTNSQGEIECWFDGAHAIDLNVTDNADAAYLAAAPSQLLSWTAFPETVEVFPPPAEIVLPTKVQTFTVAQHFADIRTKLRPINPTFSDFGAVCDGGTDDSDAWDRVLAYIGDASQFRAVEIYVPGPSAISRSLKFTKVALTMYGHGVGGQRTPGPGLDSGFVWIGNTTSPMLIGEQANLWKLRNLRFTGNPDPTRRPDSAIQFFVPTPYQIPNSRNELDGIYIGPVYAYDGSNVNPWVNKGIAFEGQNLQNDQTIIRNLTVRLANYGYYAPNSQSVLNSLEHARFDFCGTGVYTRAHLYTQNVLCSVCSVTDFDIASCRVSLFDYNSESSAKMAKVRGYAEVFVQGRYFQISNYLAGSSSPGTIPVIDAVDIYRPVIVLNNFEFQDAGYTNSGTPKLSVKVDAASFAKKVLGLNNVTWMGNGIDASNIDTAIGFGGGADELVVYGNSMKPTGIGQERFFFNHLNVGNPTPDFNRNDLNRTGMAPMRVKAGAVTDSDFPFTPLPGTFAYDSTNQKIGVRGADGTWRWTAALT